METAANPDGADGRRQPHKALDGIVVLELGMVMQVPLAAQMLGDFGADVIKIERPAPRRDSSHARHRGSGSWPDELLLCGALPQ